MLLKLNLLWRDEVFLSALEFATAFIIAVELVLQR